MAKKLTSLKAKEILHDKSVHGKPLTDKQRKFFGAIAGGAKPYKDGGWLEKYGYGGEVNYNDAEASFGPNFVGAGYDTTGRNYSPAWGGQFAMGGALPGATGMMYARTINPAPSNGPYAKKTKASAQNGKEMKFYQEGLDWKPNNISQDGSIIDPMGQWAHPGEITTIPSNNITMKGVPYPVLGVSDKGDKKMMKPGKDYKFKGSKVTEYPMAEFGDYFQDSGQAQIGGAVGEAAGNALFGPLGGMAGKLLGNVAGNLLGGAADANKLARYQSQTQANTQKAAMQQSLQSGQFSSFMKNGGWLDKYK